MKTVAVTVNIPADTIADIARLELGMTASQPQYIPVAKFHERSEAVAAAIQHVIRATEKFDRDQYSPGERSAATALFEAGKRLRKAVSEEAKYKKGNFHV